MSPDIRHAQAERIVELESEVNYLNEWMTAVVKDGQKIMGTKDERIAELEAALRKEHYHCYTKELRDPGCRVCALIDAGAKP